MGSEELNGAISKEPEKEKEWKFVVSQDWSAEGKSWDEIKEVVGHKLANAIWASLNKTKKAGKIGVVTAIDPIEKTITVREQKILVANKVGHA